MWNRFFKNYFISSQLTQLRKYSKFSYSFCPSSHPLTSKTIPDIVDENATECPDKIAVISHHQGIVKTFSQLQKDVNQLAKVLLGLGCGHGDRVGIWAPNCYEWVLTQLATAKIGSILTNINPGYRTKELEYCLNLAHCHTIIASQSVKTSNYFEMLQELLPDLQFAKNTENLNISKMPYLKNIVLLSHPQEKAPANFTRFDDLMKSAPDKTLSNEKQFDDIINIQFTSGTTGSPKGASLTNHNMVNNAIFFHRRMYPDDSEFIKNLKICVPVPLYHCFGNVGGTILAAVGKAAFILPCEVFNPNEIMKVVQEYRCNVLYGTPTMYVDMLQTVSEYDTSSLVRSIMSGSLCPVELLKRTKAMIPTMKNIIIPYGATELSPVITSTSIYDSEKQQLESVGTALDHTEIKIVDPITGKILPKGEAGEILSRGYSTFLGYWNEEEKTNQVINKSRWYHTGDIGVMDNDGYISITGRIKDMIIRGGENIFPKEIEDFFLQNNKIQEIHIVGVPDKRMGEEMCAFVRFKSGSQLDVDDLKNYCKGKISHFKIPKYFEFVEDYPRTVTGKVQKYILREIAAKKFDHS